MTDEIAIEVPTEDDWPAIFATMATAFNDEAEEASSAAERTVYEPQRCLVARRDGQIVGTAGIFTRQLSVPGAMVPTGHVTFVSVRPTARRRGILTRFIHRQFDDMRAIGEPVAALWASEGRIYQRFGYGLATRRVSIEAENREITLSAVAGGGRLREGSPDELRDILVKVYDQTYASRPGWSERASRHWDYRLADPESWRRGATPLRILVHEGEHGADGYVLWRVHSKWTDSGPAGEVRVLEQVATNPQAYAALWRFLLTVDLTRTTQCWALAVDEPLQFMVNEPRRLNMRMTDGLWVRLVDVPAALAARRYAAPIDVVIEVKDPLIGSNAGRWRLSGSPDTASCRPTADEPDLVCDVKALGAGYLGGTPLTALAQDGLVVERRPGALATATVAFGWHRAPSTTEVF